MDTNTLLIIAISIGVLILVGLGAMALSRRRHTQQLRDKFGPEYDYTVEQIGDRRKAEADLEEREKRVEALELRSLAPEERDRFHQAWNEAQGRFVDQPAEAVADANQLINEVLEARGFPINHFEQRSADLSVLYPNVVQNYRAARRIAEKNEREGATTEELRQAMVYYRSLFDELLEPKEIEPKEQTV